ncbi:hypothetical protein CEXT_25531 [Caerostris extrusa]|uniref:Uncharacterized protein n=1 Tax=Caerostris extrusa TaxID=172846 RepID=A0AAV4Y7K6_CAEEX|nr:hypothetical protein CEXT_25531 [Caerostris extrusa]
MFRSQTCNVKQKRENRVSFLDWYADTQEAQVRQDVSLEPLFECTRMVKEALSREGLGQEVLKNLTFVQQDIFDAVLDTFGEEDRISSSPGTPQSGRILNPTHTESMQSPDRKKCFKIFMLEYRGL